MFRLIIDRRIQNELEPTVNVLHEVVDQLDESDHESHSQRKMSELLAVLDTASDIYADLQNMPTEQLVRMIQLRGVVEKVLRLTS
jgi:DNA-binding transcriptional regulator GbsR (MarR family)